MNHKIEDILHLIQQDEKLLSTIDEIHGNPNVCAVCGGIITGRNVIQSPCCMGIVVSRSELSFSTHKRLFSNRRIYRNLTNESDPYQRKSKKWESGEFGDTRINHNRFWKFGHSGNEPIIIRFQSHPHIIFGFLDLRTARKWLRYLGLSVRTSSGREVVNDHQTIILFEHFPTKIMAQYGFDPDNIVDDIYNQDLIDQLSSSIENEEV